ncbi:MAG: rod shape-determining protein MreC [Pseudomonadota bacterium]
MRGGTSLALFMFVSVCALVLTKLNHPIVQQTRLEVAEASAPALQAALVPLTPVRRFSEQVAGYFRQAAELDRLREENRRLRGWQWRAKELERRLRKVRAIAKVVRDPALTFVTGRVIADASGPFVRVALLNAGARQGVRSGYPAVNADGLVGRIVETGPTISRLLLLTDINSRVPVLVGDAGHRAVLMGDNSMQPKLAYLSPDARIKPGDDVYTSGVGGLFPSGVRIGVVHAKPGHPSVRLHARLDKLEYASILFFQSPQLKLAGDEPANTRHSKLARRLLQDFGGQPGEPRRR